MSDFEREFAAFSGARHAIATGNGTDALELAMRAVDVGAGDVVITVPNTFIATAEAAIVLGASIRFVDVDPITRNMDPERFEMLLHEEFTRSDGEAPRERRSGRRLAAVIPVHLYGLPSPMERVQQIARDWGVPVIEDACQAHGASYRLSDGTWVPVGTNSKAACFSFFPAKNLGGLGEAGALVTDDDALASSARILRDHGQSERYLHVTHRGRNSRVDALQAGALSIKLRRLPVWNARRREAASRYRDFLVDTAIAIPLEPDGYRHVYHLYVIEIDRRDAVRTALANAGIETGLHYPVPLHLQPAFTHLNLGRGSYPASEALASRGVSLPMHPHLRDEEVDRVAEALLEAVTADTSVAR